MSENIKQLTVGLSLTTDNFTQKMKVVNQQLKTLKSNYKSASADSKSFDNSFVGLATSKKFYHAGEREFSITANQSVSWNAKCEDEVYSGETCKYAGTISTTATVFKGTLAAIYTNSDGRTSNNYANSEVTFSTPAGQSLTLTIGDFLVLSAL